MDPYALAWARGWKEKSNFVRQSKGIFEDYIRHYKNVKVSLKITHLVFLTAKVTIMLMLSFLHDFLFNGWDNRTIPAKVIFEQLQLWKAILYVLSPEHDILTWQLIDENNKILA